LDININANYQSNVSHGNVDNGGEVYFNCAASGNTFVITQALPDGSNAFQGETNNYVTLQQGNNGPYHPSKNNITIHWCACGSMTNPCNPDPLKMVGGYTIQVGNPPEGGEHRHK